MRDGVVEEAAEIGARRLRQVPHLWAYRPAMVPSAGQNRQHPARVRQTESQPGMAIENAAKDQMSCCDRRINRVPYEIRKIKRLGSLAADSIERVKEYRQGEGLDAVGEEGDTPAPTPPLLTPPP